MKKQNTFVCIALMASSIAGCASLKPEPRPVYTGGDQVGAVDSSMLIGTWQVRNMNPLENEPAMDIQVKFNDDGTATGYSKIDDGDNSNPYGKMEFEMTARWVVDGELVSQTIVSMEEVTGNPIAKFSAGLVMGFTRDKTTSVNLYEASADRLVFFNEKEGLAQQYTRVE